MRIRPTTLSAALLPLLIAGPAVVAQQPRAPAPAPGTLFLTPERVPLPDGGLGEAERGILFVPVNRSRPGSGVVGVEIWRFRAQKPSGAPPLFVLNGGPGFPGLDPALARPDFWDKYVRRFTEVTDFVVIGQRGIGSSRPDTKCANGPAYQAAVRCREFWTAKGLDLAGFTVVEAAADVKDAAAALGYDRIVVYGGSFGSHWGMAVMRYHPELVERAVLTGMEGPNHTYDSASGILNSLRRVAAAAELDPRIGALAPEGGIIGGLEATRSRLADKAVEVEAADTSGVKRKTTFMAGHVAALSNGYSGSVGSRTEIASWPADMLRLYYGDFETAARARANRPTGAATNYRTASYYMLDCGSGITAERLATLREDPARLLVGDRAAFYQAVCQAWDADLGDAFRANFDTSIPTVIVHGNWDVSTPYENALELAPHFTRGKLVTVVGGTHGALSEALEADTAFASSLWHFVRTGDRSRIPDSVVLPPIDWSVPADLEALARRVMGPGGGSPGKRERRTAMMRSGLVLVGILLVGCGGRAGDDGAAAADSVPALTLADVAGRWAMQAWRDTGSVVLTTYELVGTADPASWQILFPNRQPVPLRVTVAGDSMVAEAGPYESVLRSGVAVVTRTVNRLEGGRLVGTFMARYATNVVDSVLRGRTEGSRVP